MYQPWVAHYYPGLTLAAIEAGEWSLSSYVAMADFVRAGPR
jgi:hypothetical protein